jgi:thymidylate synthase ThyX
MNTSQFEVTLIDSMGGDLAVVNAARVSFNKQRSEYTDGDKRLIQYLAQHGHWTPFSQVQYQVRIKAQRTDAHAQVEIQELAKMFGDCLKDIAPISWGCLT